ncbi:MAG: DUF933 domain-containing protein [Bacillota bacterium]
MKISLIGPSASGKSTLFRLLTGCSGEVGVAKVPDLRVDRLSAMFNPRKTTYATIELRDPKQQAPNLAALIKQSDMAMVVLGVYSGSDPVKELDELVTQLVLSDLEQVENSIERLKKSRNGRENQIPELERLREFLAQGQLLQSSLEGLPEALKGHDFATLRKVLVAANLSEDQLQLGYPGKQRLHAFCAEHGLQLIEFSPILEAEIAQLPLEEQLAFMKSYGLDEPGIYRLSRTAYSILGLISFFTVGEDEVRAWPVKRGSTALDAAAKIHSDIARGFIRAEVIHWQELVQAGSMKAARQAGLIRLESKAYPVKDGDVIHFRFNV